LVEIVARLLIRNSPERLDQFNFLTAKRDTPCHCGLGFDAFEEKGYRASQELCSVEEAACGDPILSVLVFLHGLERYSNAIAQLVLTDTTENSCLKQPLPHMHINRIRSMSTNCATRLPRILRLHRSSPH
jgi:hypothetical protein